MDRLRGTGSSLTLIGGEARALIEWTRAAREAGFARVLAAPGPAGLPPAALTELTEAGLAGVSARLYAADAGAHDHHAGLAGSFRAAVALLRAARAARVPTTVTTPLTRSNARVLAALPGLLADVAAIGWRVRVHQRYGSASPQGATVPRLAVALPFALQAMTAAERAGIAAAIEGAPSCLLGPLRDRGLPGAARAFPAGCEGCELRARCPGLDAEYLRRFGPGELTPLRATGAATPGRANRLQDMFSGTCLEVSEGACWPI